MHKLLMIRTVVVHNVQDWDAVMCCCPQDARRIHQIAVALNVYGKAAMLPVGEGSTDGGWCVVAHAGGARATVKLVVLFDGPRPQRPPAEVHNIGDHRPVLVFDRFPELGGQAGSTDGARVPRIACIRAQLLHLLMVCRGQIGATGLELCLTSGGYQTLHSLN